MEVADQIVGHEPGPDRAGRHAARALRRAGERVRDGLRRARRTGSATAACARTTSTSRTSRPTARSRRWSSGSCRLGFEVRVELSRRRRRADLRVQVTRDAARGARARARPDRVGTLRRGSGRSPSSDAPASRRPGDEIGDRRLLEDAAHRRSRSVDPDVAERDRRALVGRRPRAVRRGRRDRAFDGADHVGEGDLGRRSREPVAAVGAALAARRGLRGEARAGCSRETSAGSTAPWRAARLSPRPRPARRPARSSHGARSRPWPRPARRHSHASARHLAEAPLEEAPLGLVRRPGPERCRTHRRVGVAAPGAAEGPRAAWNRW